MPIKALTLSLVIDFSPTKKGEKLEFCSYNYFSTYNINSEIYYLILKKHFNDI